MNHIIQAIIALITANPLQAHLIIFLISAGEAVFILGLFIPSTPVLLACGTLIGVGKLAFWPVFVVAALGAMAGDALSYWIGHIFKDRIHGLWPFNRHIAVVERGEAFFHRHGGASVFIGRFIPGVKAVVPGIAGILGMGWVRFTVINCISALAWAGAHLVPAALISSGIAASGRLDPHLVPILIAVAAFVVAAWYALEFALKRRGISLVGLIFGWIGKIARPTSGTDLRD
ncbi:MAG TPA: DedA family protein [Devosiaceae bacterium]